MRSGIDTAETDFSRGELDRAHDDPAYAPGPEQPDIPSKEVIQETLATDLRQSRQAPDPREVHETAAGRQDEVAETARVESRPEPAVAQAPAESITDSSSSGYQDRGANIADRQADQVEDHIAQTLKLGQANLDTRTDEVTDSRRASADEPQSPETTDRSDGGGTGSGEPARGGDRGGDGRGERSDSGDDAVAKDGKDGKDKADEHVAEFNDLAPKGFTPRTNEDGKTDHRDAFAAELASRTAKHGPDIRDNGDVHLGGWDGTEAKDGEEGKDELDAGRTRHGEDESSGDDRAKGDDEHHPVGTGHEHEIDVEPHGARDRLEHDPAAQRDDSQHRDTAGTGAQTEAAAAKVDPVDRDRRDEDSSSRPDAPADRDRGRDDDRHESLAEAVREERRDYAEKVKLTRADQTRQAGPIDQKLIDEDDAAVEKMHRDEDALLFAALGAISLALVAIDNAEAAHRHELAEERSSDKADHDDNDGHEDENPYDNPRPEDDGPDHDGPRKDEDKEDKAETSDRLADITALFVAGADSPEVRDSVMDRVRDTKSAVDYHQAYRQRMDHLKTLKRDGFRDDRRLAYLQSMIAASGLPTDKLRAFVNAPDIIHRDPKTGREIGRTVASMQSGGEGDGTFTAHNTFFDTKRRGVEEQKSTVVHEILHRYSPFRPENDDVYGGQTNREQLATYVLQVANQSLATGDYLNGYQKMLAKEYFEAERKFADPEAKFTQLDLDRAKAKFCEETGAIITEMSWFNRKGLEIAQQNQQAKLERWQGMIDAAAKAGKSVPKAQLPPYIAKYGMPSFVRLVTNTADPRELQTGGGADRISIQLLHGMNVRTYQDFRAHVERYKGTNWRRPRSVDAPNA